MLLHTIYETQNEEKRGLSMFKVPVTKFFLDKMIVSCCLS